ncbi:hypothetical protein [Streptomyces globisporus]|uniref:hypothetical protein n=1 Tax=Streptomyces globisporus TaxID=1908 RepID=UPI000A3F1D20|nr:hypothetical protein [Streptomyces globisporus]
MGHSRAHAVFTTTDADDAYARARQLAALIGGEVVGDVQIGWWTARTAPGPR